MRGHKPPYKKWYEEARSEIEQLQATRISDLSAHDVLDWLLLQLPRGRWTHEQRRDWLAVYTAVLNMAIEVVPDNAAPDDGGEEEGA